MYLSGLSRPQPNKKRAHKRICLFFSPLPSSSCSSQSFGGKQPIELGKENGNNSFLSGFVLNSTGDVRSLWGPPCRTTLVLFVVSQRQRTEASRPFFLSTHKHILSFRACVCVCVCLKISFLWHWSEERHEQNALSLCENEGKPRTSRGRIFGRLYQLDQHCPVDEHPCGCASYQEHSSQYRVDCWRNTGKRY